jgi:hypothetical protein
MAISLARPVRDAIATLKAPNEPLHRRRMFRVFVGLAEGPSCSSTDYRPEQAVAEAEKSIRHLAEDLNKAKLSCPPDGLGSDVGVAEPCTFPAFSAETPAACKSRRL